MTFATESLPPRVLRTANLAVLENIMLRFQLPHVTGTVTLRSTPMEQHLRLEFLSSGGRLVRGRFFHEEILCEPERISRLIQESAAFMSEVSRCKENAASDIDELHVDRMRAVA
jgi:hypothetical protein